MISALILSIALEAGTMPNYVKRMNYNHFNETAYYQLTEARLTAFDMLYLDTSTLIESIKAPSWNFAPVNSTYTVGVGINFNGFTFGAEHSCTHPVLSALPGKIVTMDYYASYDKLFVRYELEFKP